MDLRALSQWVHKMKIVGTFLALLALSLGLAWPASMAILSGSPPTSSVDSPDDISGLVLWLKADTGVEEASADSAEDGDTVQFWRDQSGNGHDASQSTGSSRPEYQTNEVNGLPVVRFVSADALETSSLGAVGTVIVVVGRVTHTNANAVAGVIVSSAAKRVVTFYPDSSTIYGGDSSEFFGGSIPTWVNGVSTYTFPTSPAFGIVSQTGSPITPEGGIIIGVSAINDPFIGDIAEIIIYDTALSGSNRAAIEAYLDAKYGL